MTPEIKDKIAEQVKLVADCGGDAKAQLLVEKCLDFFANHILPGVLKSAQREAADKAWWESQKNHSLIFSKRLAALKEHLKQYE